MSWAGRRRIGYLLFCLLFAGALLVLALVFLKTEPSCSDGKQNQSELGVDCGGICKAVCPSEAKALKVWWSRVVVLTDTIYETATLVENPNRDFGVIDAAYSISYFDSENLIINRRDGKLSLYPGERFVVFEPSIDVGRRTPVKSVFEWRGGGSWYRPNVGKPSLSWVNRGFSQDPNPLQRAALTNQSLFPIYNIQVVATLSDINKNLIAVSRTLVESLEAGETRDVTFSWPKTFDVTPAVLELFPHLDKPLLQ